MRPLVRLAVAGLALLAGCAAARADEPMEGTFRASRSCQALLSIRKDTNPGHVITGPGISYQLLARNQKRRHPLSHRGARRRPAGALGGGRLRQGLPAAPAARPPGPPPAPAPAGAKPKPDPPYVLALSWQPAFCETNQRKPECRWQTGNRYDAKYLSLHGLWPQPSGTEYCNLPAAVRAAGEGGRWKDIPDVASASPPAPTSTP